MKSSVLTAIASPQVAALGQIYAISAGVFRGFQIGDPEVTPYEARTYLFDGTNRHFAFDVSTWTSADTGGDQRASGLNSANF